MDPTGPRRRRPAATLKDALTGSSAVGHVLHGAEPWARFDDAAAGRSVELRGCLGQLVAREQAEVAPTIEAAERAAAGGAWIAGFVAYEAAAGLDPSLPGAAGPPVVATPLVWFGRFTECRTVPALTPPSDHTGATAPAGAAARGGEPHPPWALGVAEDRHAGQVAVVRSHIEAGDVYQCNLTARYRSRVVDAFALYRGLVTAQRSAHCAFVHTGEVSVASASPELFFEWVDDRVTTRPMKGTARRGRWSEEDTAAGAALCASAKDRAENLMIVDLLRNDLGKVAVYGSVDVPELFSLERYPTVWQLTSTVTARSRPGTTLVELFRALFPSGSVTGAPKRRAMQVIDDLEDSARGVYCGALGVVAPPGAGFRARFSVPIRTAVVDPRGGSAVYGAGGGIVWDSVASAEYQELVAKSSVLSTDHSPCSLLETMRATAGDGVLRWSGHRARLLASARYFGVPVDPGHLDEVVRCAAGGVRRTSRLRLLVDPAGRATVEVDALSPPSPGPVRLAVDPEPVDPKSPWLFHKTTRRAVYQDRSARHPGADQVVLVNPRGEPTETTVANLAVRLGDRWWTPPVAAGCLPGVLRAELVACGRLTERPLTLDDLAAADGLAVVSALRGWRPAELSG